MTRINIGIKPQKLTDKHLLAEHREIKRIPNHLKKYGEKCLTNIPESFKLGTGHVKFFLNKGEYTFIRYLQLYQECKNRGFNVTDYSQNWNIYNDYNFKNLWNDYAPTIEDVNLIEQRINERLSVSKFHNQLKN